MPSMPDSWSAGWMAFVGHTFMHWPQRMHRARNSSSSREPGGRIRRGLRFLARPKLARNSGRATTPAAFYDSPPLQIGPDLDRLGLLFREKLESDDIVRANAFAVETEMAFRLFPWNIPLGFAGALAVEEAAVAVVAFGVILLHAEKRPAREQHHQSHQ